jgi:hypothetical protein
MTEPVLTGGPATLNVELEKQITAFGLKRIKFKDLYYLPGRQTDAPSPGVFTSDIYDDITIVLQE